MEIYIVDTPEIIGTTIFHCQNCSNVFDIPQEYEELPSLSVFKFSNEIHVFIAIVLKGIKTQKEPEYYPIQELTDKLAGSLVDLGNRPPGQKVIKNETPDDYLNGKLT